MNNENETESFSDFEKLIGVDKFDSMLNFDEFDLGF